MRAADAVLGDALLDSGIALSVWQVRALDQLARFAEADERYRAGDRAWEVLRTPTLDRAHARAIAFGRAVAVSRLRGTRRSSEWGALASLVPSLFGTVAGGGE